MHDLGRTILQTDRMVGEAESAEHREFLEVLGGLLREESAPRRARRQEHEMGGASDGTSRETASWPPGPNSYVQSGTENVMLRSAVRSGMTDENQLVNLIFFRRHPERNGRLISGGEPNFQKLSQEWLRIRDTLVRPILRGTTPGQPAPSFTTAGLLPCRAHYFYKVMSDSGLSPATLANYGNWCGKGGTGPVLDSMDQCCKEHDECYGEDCDITDLSCREKCDVCDKKAVTCWLRAVAGDPARYGTRDNIRYPCRRCGATLMLPGDRQRCMQECRPSYIP
ncbi:MAG: phospholipase A2 family protein [Pseudonocardiaceae bacterium]